MLVTIIDSFTLNDVHYHAISALAPAQSVMIQAYIGLEGGRNVYLKGKQVNSEKEALNAIQALRINNPQHWAQEFKAQAEAARFFFAHKKARN